MRKRDLALAIGGALGVGMAFKMLTRAPRVDWDDVADLVPHSAHSHFAEIDGQRLHYQEFGNATQPAIVLIHGYTASTYVWKTTAPMLADAGFRVIAVDLLGFGFSAKPARGDYSIEAHASRISRLMNRLGVGRTTVVGSSYGGAVALTMALDYPERVEKLVLVSSVINDEPKNHPVLRLVNRRGIGEILTPFIADSRIFLRRRMMRTIAPANHHLVSRERMDSIRRPLRSREGHRSLLATSRAWNAGRIEQDLHLIDAPTLIIWGDQDNVVAIKHGHKLHQEILNSRFVVLRDCGHVPPEEKTEMFVELVGEFCRNTKRRVRADAAIPVET